MGSYDFDLPSSATPVEGNNSCHLNLTENMGASEDGKHLSLNNFGAAGDTSDQLQGTEDESVKDGLSEHTPDHRKREARSYTTKLRTSARSISESECTTSVPQSNLARLTRKDTTDGKTSCKGSDWELLNNDFEGLPLPDEVALPVPPDGGWGWVIVAVSFVCCAVVDGLCSVFGVILPELVIYFNEMSSKMSLAGSVLAGGFLLSGPIASAIINCLGCRWATIIGSILSASALIASIWAPTTTVFILVFGGIGGLGLGLIYLPASVMVGYYFERRRGLAAGISSAGSGIGMLVLSPLAAFLVELFGWKGCLIIMAGVSLQCLICGALMRPLLPTLNVLKPDNFLDKDENKKLPRRVESFANGFKSSLMVIEENVILACADEPRISNTCQTLPESLTDSKQSLEVKCSEVGTSPSAVRGPSGEGIVTDSCNELAQKFDTESMDMSPVRATTQQMSDKRRLSVRSSSTTNSYCQEQFSSRRSVGDGGSVRTNLSNSVHSVVNPLMRKDIFFSGSTASLQNSISKDKEAETSLPALQDMYRPAAYVQRSVLSQAVHMLKEMLDVSIFCNFSFLLISSANIFIQLAYFVPIVFLPAYARSLGLSPSQSATLLAVVGVSTMFGRAAAGALASLRCVNGLHLNNLTLIGAGISTTFVVLCTNFELLVAYAAVFGLCVAGFVPMTTVFLVKYVGLEKLTNSFGLLSMIKGVSTMAGPPIAGALLDSSQSYDSAFYFAGAMFVCAGVLFYALPLTQRPVSLATECALFHRPSKHRAESGEPSLEYKEKGGFV